MFRSTGLTFQITKRSISQTVLPTSRNQTLNADRDKTHKTHIIPRLSIDLGFDFDHLDALLLRPCGGVVTQRIANPCTPVRVRAGPPAFPDKSDSSQFHQGKPAGMSLDTLPGNSGKRFSRKAATPSLTSSVEPSSLAKLPSSLSKSNGCVAGPNRQSN